MKLILNLLEGITPRGLPKDIHVHLGAFMSFYKKLEAFLEF